MNARLKLIHSHFIVSSLWTVLNLLFINAGNIPTDKEKAKGQLPLTTEESAKLGKNRVKKVFESQRAIERLNIELRRNGKPEISKVKNKDDIMEFETNYTNPGSGLSGEPTALIPTNRVRCHSISGSG